MSTTGDKRLLRLADFLDTLPRSRFDYTRWVGADWKGAADLSCGTTACALGWATTIPSLRRAGLRLHQGGYVTLAQDPKDDPFEAAMEVFDLGWGDAYELFFPHSATEGRATPKYVARKIRKFVREHAR